MIITQNNKLYQRGKTDEENLVNWEQKPHTTNELSDEIKKAQWETESWKMSRHHQGKVRSRKFQAESISFNLRPGRW